MYVSWCTIVHHRASSCIIVQRCESSCIIVYHHASSCIYHRVSSCIIVYHRVLVTTVERKSWGAMWQDRSNSLSRGIAVNAKTRQQSHGRARVRIRHAVPFSSKLLATRTHGLADRARGKHELTFLWRRKSRLPVMGDMIETPHEG